MKKAIIDVYSDAQAAIMAGICDYAYVNPSESPPGGLRYLSDRIDTRFDEHGHNFSARVVKLKPDCVVIAFRGTWRLWTDIRTDCKMFLYDELAYWAVDDDQHAAALYKYVNKVLDAYPGYHIIFAGHSLGGALVKLCALRYGWQAIAFNSFSILKIQKEYFKDKNDYSLLSNVRVKGDLVSANVDEECSKGATFRELDYKWQFADLIPLHKAVTAHGIEKFREKLEHKAKKALEKIGKTRESFWAEFSTTPVETASVSAAASSSGATAGPGGGVAGAAASRFRFGSAADYAAAVDELMKISVISGDKVAQGTGNDNAAASSDGQPSLRGGL